MISQRSRYALKAILFLARCEPGTPVRAAEIAASQNIPEPFLDHILVDLRRAGLVDSKRGKQGGHCLALPGGEISLAKVLRLIEGPVAPVTCLSRTAYRRCEDCRDERECDLRHLFQETHNAMLMILEKRTLADIVERADLIDETLPGFFEGANI